MVKVALFLRGWGLDYTRYPSAIPVVRNRYLWYGCFSRMLIYSSLVHSISGVVVPSTAAAAEPAESVAVDENCQLAAFAPVAQAVDHNLCSIHYQNGGKDRSIVNGHET